MYLKEAVKIAQQKWSDEIEPVVSISCITYNHANYIRDAIEGFLMQKTTFPVEILIHDDASIDGTTEIIREYEAKHPRLFKCFYESENTWNMPNMRELWKPFRDARRGKYIAQCEGDDYWTDPLKLQKQIDFLEKNPEYSFTCGGVSKVYMELNKQEDVISLLPGIKIEKNGYSFSLMDTTSKWITETATLVYRNTDKIQSEIKSYKHCSDITLNYVILKNGKGFYFTDLLAVYRKHNGGIYSGQELHVNLNIARKTYEELYKKNRDKFTRIRYFTYSLSLLKYNIQNKYKGNTIAVNLVLFLKSFALIRGLKDLANLIFIFILIRDRWLTKIKSSLKSV